MKKGKNMNLIKKYFLFLVPLTLLYMNCGTLPDVDTSLQTSLSYCYRFSNVKIIKNVNIDYQGKTMTFFKEED